MESRSGDQFALKVVIPPNVSATVWIPAGGDVTEGGVPAEKSDGVRFVRREDGTAVYETKAGTYRFESRMP